MTTYEILRDEGNYEVVARNADGSLREVYVTSSKREAERVLRLLRG